MTWRGFGRSDRMRVPWPAAKTIAEMLTPHVLAPLADRSEAEPREQARWRAGPAAAAAERGGVPTALSAEGASSERSGRVAAAPESALDGALHHRDRTGATTLGLSAGRHQPVLQRLQVADDALPWADKPSDHWIVAPHGPAEALRDRAGKTEGDVVAEHEVHLLALDAHLHAPCRRLLGREVRGVLEPELVDASGQIVRLDPERREDLGREAVVGAGERFEEVVAAHGTAPGQLLRRRQRLLGPGVRPVSQRRRSGPTCAPDLLEHAGAHLIQARTLQDEHLRGEALTLTDDAEEDVLGADVVVAELPSASRRESSSTFLALGVNGMWPTGAVVAPADDGLDPGPRRRRG